MSKIDAFAEQVWESLGPGMATGSVTLTKDELCKLVVGAVRYGATESSLTGEDVFPGSDAGTPCEMCGTWTPHARFCAWGCYLEHKDQTKKPLPFTKSQMLSMLEQLSYRAIGENFSMPASTVRYFCLHRLGLSLSELQDLKEQRRIRRNSLRSGDSP